MNIAFLYMSKNYRIFNELPKDENINTVIRSLPKSSIMNSNYFSILKRLSELGHNIDFFMLLDSSYLNKYSKENIILIKEFGINTYLCSDAKSIQPYIANQQLIIIRGNYSEWNLTISAYINNIILLPCWSKINYNNIRIAVPNTKRFTVFVDDQELQESFEMANIKTQVFKKPAPEFFYNQPLNNEKVYDMIHICRKSDRPHKRIDILLKSLNMLNKTLVRPIQLLLIGDYSSHQNIFPILDKIKITEIKHLSRNDILASFDKSKISLCYSDWDANPRTIGESLARNTPVLCISDLKGGKFQIKPGLTGEFFQPDLSDFCLKANHMISNYNQYKARDNFTTIDDACNQIIGVIES